MFSNTLIDSENFELTKIVIWFQALPNKLSLNIKKANCVLFKPRQRNCSSANRWQNNRSGTTNVLSRSYFKNQLSWKTHNCHVASKEAKTIGIIYKSKYFLPKKSFLSLYHSLVYRYYYNLAWDSTYKANLHRLILFQKRTVWIIDNKDYRALWEPSFKNLKIWLKVFEINSLQTGIFMFSYCNHLLPSTSTIFSHLVLLSMITILDLHRLLGQFSISYQGPLFWNSLGKHLTPKICDHPYPPVLEAIFVCN